MRRRGLSRLGALLLGLAILGAPCLAEDATPSDKDRDKARRDTLKFGIDTEITDLLGSLAAEKESSYNDDILSLFESSRSLKLRSTILDFFSQLEWKPAEDAAIQILKDRDKEDPGLVAASLSYLAQVKSKKALGLAKVLLDEGDKKVLPSLIKLLGRAGGSEEEDLLLGYLDRDDATDDLKQSAIRALGDIGSAKAADRLIKLVADALGGKSTRMVAAESLGKIGNPKAIRPLVDAANGEDVNVRASAVSALAQFDGKEASGAIIAALRDNAVQVRLAGCKAAAARKLLEAVPALSYKVSNDPEKAVKAEALRSLAAIGGKEAFGFLVSLLENPKSDTVLRVSAFGLLLRKSPDSIPTLEKRLKAEAGEKDKSLYTAFAREISGAADSPAALPLAKVLLGDSDYLIRLGGLEWMRRNKGPALKADLAALASGDPSDYVRRKAQEILDSIK